MNGTPNGNPTMPGATTPGRKVLGWLIVCFTVIPLSMAAHGEGAVYLWTGAVALAVGGAMALLPGRRTQ